MELQQAARSAFDFLSNLKHISIKAATRLDVSASAQSPATSVKNATLQRRPAGANKCVWSPRADWPATLRNRKLATRPAGSSPQLAVGDDHRSRAIESREKHG
ncbi:hypothetical protein CIHG_03984 [Coccidioides immitis H538.4]|uniref:Uncharacterized protein n=3 Tax=Coccidioides immitis TaxID=5501 RepID=A0A0J8QQV4_COCIT|nr:hypothetical protein CIRG_03734 [Coccidioides immitis RMSCC 2394]KMU75019.1 hypothetical protein CISG_00948 [Coccidioides immitis RMSCC 3703]KMU86196.1 hypothetical protein CIHG_03984 [Coccidioides immitis H538.4]